MFEPRLDGPVVWIGLAQATEMEASSERPGGHKPTANPAGTAVAVTGVVA